MKQLRKSLSLFCALAMALTFLSIPALAEETAFAGGSGTADAPWQIASVPDCLASSFGFHYSQFMLLPQQSRVQRFFASFSDLKDMFKRISCDHSKTREATAMLSVSKIVVKTEAMFDLFNHHFYSSEPTNLGFTFAALDGFIRRKIITCNFPAQE